MPFTEKHLNTLLSTAITHNASDIHLREDESPCFRIRGDLIPVQSKKLTKDHMKEIMEILLKDNNHGEILQNQKEIDGGYSAEGIARIRFNQFLFQDKIGIIMRIIPQEVPTILELGLPNILETIANQQRGLILVTGATGSGKSTTLAAMIDHINKTQQNHIITIEDPVEYIHTSIKSRISQRSIGPDTATFDDGLRSAMRQDPDVILIGEMRDAVTISTALKASETGHTVFSTLHTTDALKSIGRLIAMFPPEEQREARIRLAENLFAIISQRLIKSVTGKMTAAMEIMITSPGIKDCIEGKDDLGRIMQIMKEGKTKTGIHSQTFDQHLSDLLKKGVISKSTALETATSQADFVLGLEVE